MIAEATRNRFFVSVMTSLRDHIVFGMNLSRDLSRMQSAAQLKAVRDEHRRVFDAIRARPMSRHGMVYRNFSVVRREAADIHPAGLRPEGWERVRWPLTAGRWC